MHIADDFSENIDEIRRIFPQIESINPYTSKEKNGKLSKRLSIKLSFPLDDKSKNTESLCHLFNLFIVPLFVLSQFSLQKHAKDNKFLNTDTYIDVILNQITLFFKNEKHETIKIEISKIIDSHQHKKYKLLVANKSALNRALLDVTGKSTLEKKSISIVKEHVIEVNNISISGIKIETILANIDKLMDFFNIIEKESYKRLTKDNMCFIYDDKKDKIFIALLLEEKDKNLLSRVEEDFDLKRTTIKFPSHQKNTGEEKIIKIINKAKLPIKDIDLQHNSEISNQNSDNIENENIENIKKPYTNQLNTDVEQLSNKHIKHPKRNPFSNLLSVNNDNVSAVERFSKKSSQDKSTNRTAAQALPNHNLSPLKESPLQNCNSSTKARDIPLSSNINPQTNSQKFSEKPLKNKSTDKKFSQTLTDQTPKKPVDTPSNKSKIIKNSKSASLSLKENSNKEINTNSKIKTLKNIFSNKICIFTILTLFALTATVASYFAYFYKYINADKRNKVENILIIGGSLLIAVLISGFIANSYSIYRETLKQPKNELSNLTHKPNSVIPKLNQPT